MGSAYAADAAPRVRVVVNASQPVLVGRQIEVEVTVLAPNFFMSAPPFPPLQIAGAIVTMPDERGQNSTEVIDGVTYAGIQKRYVFAAGQAGDFRLPPVSMAFTYAGDDGAAREGSVTLPPTWIRAADPAGVGRQGTPDGGATGASAAAGGLLPVARLTVTQRFDRPLGGKSVHLRAGDAVVRTVTVVAAQTQAMMIRPPRLEAPSGVRLFIADPVLGDNVRDSAGLVGGQRTDRVTYVFERAGNYRLPAVTVDWVDPATGKPAHSSVPAVSVEVDSAAGEDRIAPAGPTAGVVPVTTRPRWEGWTWIVAVLAAATLLALLLHRLLPSARAWRRRLANRRRERATGTRAQLDAAIDACRASDAPRADRALASWTRAAFGLGALAWAGQADDGAAVAAVMALQRWLYGGSAHRSGPWDGAALRRALMAWRNDIAHGERGRGHACALPPLNRSSHTTDTRSRRDRHEPVSAPVRMHPRARTDDHDDLP